MTINLDDGWLFHHSLNYFYVWKYFITRRLGKSDVDIRVRKDSLKASPCLLTVWSWGGSVFCAVFYKNSGSCHLTGDCAQCLVLSRCPVQALFHEAHPDCPPPSPLLFTTVSPPVSPVYLPPSLCELTINLSGISFINSVDLQDIWKQGLCLVFSRALLSRLGLWEKQ